MRNFITSLFLSVTLLMSLPDHAHSQLFIERYRIDQLDMDYFWAMERSEKQMPNTYPLRQPSVTSYQNTIAPSSDDYDRYGNYLQNLYAILYGTDPQENYKTRTRSFINRLGFKEISKNFFGYNANLYGQYDRDVIVGMNPVFRLDFVHDETFKNESINVQSTGIEAWMTWKHRVGAYVRFFDTVQRGMEYYRGRHDVYESYAGFIARDKQSISYDHTTAYLGYSGSLFSARIGRGRHQWGPGRYHNLLVSHQHPPYDYVELRFHYRNLICFTYLHGILDPTPVQKRFFIIVKKGDHEKSSIVSI